MTHGNRSTTTALRPVEAELVDNDPSAIEVAYQNDVYDPRRDVRNQYPMIAQRMLLDPEMREGLTQMARDVCDSGMFGFKAQDRDLAAVRMVAIKGFAMGMDLPRALETIKVIHGMPTIRGPQALHLIRERTRGATLECKESTRARAVWKLGRPGQKAKEFVATREQVEQAGLDKKNGLWNVYPERMLKWHAFSEGAQELFGDVLMGCYITEEIHLQARFDRDLDNAIEQSEAGPRGQGRPQARESRTKAKGGKGNSKKTEPKGNQKPAENKQSESSSVPSSPKANRNQLRTLSGKLGELARAQGYRQPAEGMDDEQAKLVKQEWDNQREILWEDVSKIALDGKVAKSESLTVAEFELLAKEMDRRIAEAGEA